eukprot:1898904-Rhodomonas_salina.1
MFFRGKCHDMRTRNTSAGRRVHCADPSTRRKRASVLCCCMPATTPTLKALCHARHWHRTRARYLRDRRLAAQRRSS